MFLKLQPLVYSVIFLIGLELIVFFHERVVLIVFFLLLMALFQGFRIGHKWKFSVLPIFFVISSVTLLYFVTIRYEQQAYIILVSSMYYLSLLGAYRLSKYEGDKTAMGMNMAASTSAIFFTYAGAYGLYLNFLVPLHYLMLTYLLATLFLSYQYFSIICANKRIVWAYSLLISLVMAEIAWAINFWPFGYLTSGVIALILYFVLWDMIQGYFLNILTKKRITFNFIFFFALAILVLISSKWIPVI